MTEPTIWLLAPAAGALLGLMFYGGLWWTVRRLADSRQPALLLAASLLLRGALAAAGLYLVAAGDWRRLLAALAGLLLVRVALTRALPTPLAPR
ncbi:MAG: ATP synthase subunit I [Candidatus Competibacterales bacterium]|nr:ATP synthase subunit I [Candidatus Competibacterales bacterium]